MPRDSLQKSLIQIRDFSAADRGCVTVQTHVQQLRCRGTGRASRGMAGLDVLVLLLGGRGGHPEVGVSLAGAHICTDVLCARRCLQPCHSPSTAGHQPKMLSLVCHRCPA